MMDQYNELPVFTEQDLENCLVDDPESGRFQVARRMFDDPLIFDLEMEHIFAGTWVYLCHESQVAKPHDYFSTRIGHHPVLVTRNGEGEIKAFLNTCSHRGAQLTTNKRGNKKTFMCPFHGWTFDSNGACVDVNEQARGAYPNFFNQLNHDLHAVARLENYRGFLFASLKADVEPLVQHLRDTTKVIDMLVNQSENGLEVLKGEIKYSCRANWKTQLENIDGYHFFPTHLSYIGLIQERMKKGGNDKIKAINVSDLEKLPGGAYDFGNGHAMNWGFMPNGDDRPLAFRREWVRKTYGEATAKWMVDHVRNLILYPNMLLMDQSSTTIRVIHPITADTTQIEVYCVAPKGESAAARERRIRQFEDFLGPAGLATPDDLGVFEACQRGMSGKRIHWLQGYSRGIEQLRKGPDAEATSVGITPVISSGSVDDETLIHGAYREWKKLMRRGLQAS